MWDAPVAPWERWAKEERGEQIREGDREVHAQWCREWAPDCPDRRSRRVRRALGFRERNLSELDLDCPVRVWLERPLGKRAVIDVDSDGELPLYTPAYLNNVPQADHGYRPVNRRPPRAR